MNTAAPVATIKNPPINYETKAVALLGLGFGLLALDRWSIAVLFPAISKDLNLNYQDLGNLTGVLAIAWGITAIIMGRVADRTAEGTVARDHRIFVAGGVLRLGYRLHNAVPDAFVDGCI